MKRQINRRRTNRSLLKCTQERDPGKLSNPTKWPRPPETPSPAKDKRQWRWCLCWEVTRKGTVKIRFLHRFELFSSPVIRISRDLEPSFFFLVQREMPLQMETSLMHVNVFQKGNVLFSEVLLCWLRKKQNKTKETPQNKATLK